MGNLFYTINSHHITFKIAWSRKKIARAERRKSTMLYWNLLSHAMQGVGVVRVDLNIHPQVLNVAQAPPAD